MYERMTLSASIPQVTTVAETDATDLIEMSKAKGISVTTFIVRAVVEGLKRFPQVNSSLDGRTVVRKGYFNIGVSVATPDSTGLPSLLVSTTLTSLTSKSSLARMTITSPTLPV